MTEKPSGRPLEDVLDEFAVEGEPGCETLGRYLRLYPEYARPLIDLSQELARSVVEDDGPLSAEDQARIDAAWREHVAAAPERVADPFAVMSTTQLRDLAATLGVPRQVITAFRERRVILTSVPGRFLARFAEAVRSTPERLVSSLTSAPLGTTARSYKADNKPEVGDPVTFERVLVDAGVPEGVRAALLAEGN